MTTPLWLADMNAWLSDPTTPMHDRAAFGGGEGGVDLFSPVGTPVFALGTGQIVGIGLNNVDNKGVVTTRIDVPGYGLQDLYYQHIDLVSGLQAGQTVQQGQFLGTVTDDSNLGWSPHIELGFNSAWGGPWGDNHPGPWFDKPQPLIATLMGQGGGMNTGATSSSSTSTSTSANSGIFGGVQNMLTTFIDVLIILVIAVVIGYFGFKLLTGLDIGKMTKPAVHSAETLAKVA